MKAPEHPAKFSDEILPVFAELLTSFGLTSEDIILDPFAGTGKIHQLRDSGFKTIGIEIEPEWAGMSPFTFVGDATFLPASWTRCIAVWASSPTYGNRMSDHHDAKERCRDCKGTGITPQLKAPGALPGQPCQKCKGEGRRTYKRLTYRHLLGRDLHPMNTGQMPFKSESYKVLHRRAYAEAHRVVRDENGYLICNVKNFYEKDNVVDVVDWHRGAIIRAGFAHLQTIPVETPGMKFGANRKRVDHEEVMAFKKVPRTPHSQEVPT